MVSDARDDDRAPAEEWLDHALEVLARVSDEIAQPATVYCGRWPWDDPGVKEWRAHARGVRVYDVARSLASETSPFDDVGYDDPIGAFRGRIVAELDDLARAVVAESWPDVDGLVRRCRERLEALRPKARRAGLNEAKLRALEAREELDGARERLRDAVELLRRHGCDVGAELAAAANAEV